MKTKIATALALAALMSGCTASRLAATSEVGKLTVHLSLVGTSEGGGDIRPETPARIHVDGIYVGDCRPESPITLQLPTGRRAVSLQIGKAWDSTPESQWRVSLSAKETILILGGESSQELVFARHNLKKKTLEDDESSSASHK